MEKIDLHMHSMFSDGTDTPEEIVLKTRKAGISLIALTDHNTLAGIGPFRETGRILLLTAGSDYHGKNKAVLPAMPWML